MRGGRSRRCLMSVSRGHKLEHPITPARLISPPVTSRHISNKYIERWHLSLIACDFGRSEIDGGTESAAWQAGPSLIQQFHRVILGLFHYLPWSMTGTHFGPECSEKTCDMQFRRREWWQHWAEKNPPKNPGVLCIEPFEQLNLNSLEFSRPRRGAFQAAEVFQAKRHGKYRHISSIRLIKDVWFLKMEHETETWLAARHIRPVFKKKKMGGNLLNGFWRAQRQHDPALISGALWKLAARREELERWGGSLKQEPPLRMHTHTHTTHNRITHNLRSVDTQCNIATHPFIRHNHLKVL